MVLEKTLQSPMDSKEIQPVNPKGNEPWIFIGRTDAEAPTLWPTDEKSQLIGKDPDAGKDWGQEEKRATEDEIVGWHQLLNTHAAAAAAAAKSLQLCLTQRNPRRQPTRLARPWDSPGKNAGVGCHFLLQCIKVKSESEVSQSCLTPSDPMDCSPPGSPIHGICQARVLEWPFEWHERVPHCGFDLHYLTVGRNAN